MVDLCALHPYAAMTIGCCAIDLLANVLYTPAVGDISAAIEKTVGKRLSGYRDVAVAVVALRNGLVHRFQTGNEEVHVAISAQLPATEGPMSDRETGHYLFSVLHFTRAVYAMWLAFFTNATIPEKRAFVDLATVYIESIPSHLLGANLAPGILPGTTFAASTNTVAASGSVPFPDTFNPK